MGEKQEVTRDFEFDVADMPKEDEGAQEIAPKKSGGILGKIIGGLVLIAAAVGTGILIKKRKNKKDDEDMSL